MSLAVLLLAAWLFAACGGGSAIDDTPELTPPAGWSQPAIASADGTSLSAHLWERDSARLAIYLHEYLADQGTWWPAIEASEADGASALTIDLRGHGATPGDTDHHEGMLDDVRAAMGFARAHGYTDIALVGSGLGAALAMLVAAEEPDLFVIALAAPIEFGELEPLDVIPHLRERVFLVAADGDLSAAHSLETFVERAELPPERWQLLEGRTHGIEMLIDDRSGEPRADLAGMLDLAWNR